MKGSDKKEAIEEQEAAARFIRLSIQHISRATNKQKVDLLKVLLERPPETDALDLAESILDGLTEKEFITLCARIQKKYDNDFWTFATRIR